MLKLKDITPKNIKAFIQGYIRKWLIGFFDKRLKHINEIVAWRKQQVEEKSPECISSGQCVVCSCKTPELFYSDKPCSSNSPCYPRMQSKEEWISFKNKNSIKNGK